jgi:GTP-binding protein Era
LGKSGEGIKRVGKLAREALEDFSGKQIYLNLFVSVKKGWSKNAQSLEELGYIF